MQKTLIIAEAGVNHNGRLDLALNLCDEARKAGADVIKFQTWNTDRIITETVSKAEYQIENCGSNESQYAMLKKLELSYDSFRKIKAYCDSIGIVFASTPDDVVDLNFLISIGVPFIKIGSGDIDNIPLLRESGKSHLPVILSSGMSSLGDVDRAVTELQKNGTDDLTILHCTTSYPCKAEDVNLGAMVTLKNAFHLPVGYSDHTLGFSAATAAVALGACVIEKHFTLDKNMPGPDHRASTEPKEFKQMVDSIRFIEKAMGNGIKTPTECEIQTSKVVSKRIVANREIEAGEIFSDENLAIKRNGDGLHARYWDFVIGKKANKHYGYNEPIELF